MSSSPKPTTQTTDRPLPLRRKAAVAQSAAAASQLAIRPRHGPSPAYCSPNAPLDDGLPDCPLSRTALLSYGSPRGKLRAMSLELHELRERSKQLSAALGDDEALEVNEAILDLDPGDAVATNDSALV